MELIQNFESFCGKSEKPLCQKRGKKKKNFAFARFFHRHTSANYGK